MLQTSGEDVFKLEVGKTFTVRDSVGFAEGKKQLEGIGGCEFVDSSEVDRRPLIKGRG